MHNHPSRDPTPSQADIQMTKAIIDIAGPLWIFLTITSSSATKCAVQTT
jgi:DNA repair protein RadC